MNFDTRTDFDRWADELIEYLGELGGTARLRELYAYIEQRPKRQLKGKWEERVRFTLYENSSDSDIWKGERDLFRRIGKERSGIWALRVQTELKIVGDPEQFNEDISPNTPPEKREYVRKIFVRNHRLAGKLKQRRDYTCERCSHRPTWLTSKDTPYVEAHHLIPLGENGFDELANLIIVCPQCHRYLHHARDRAAETARLAAMRGLRTAIPTPTSATDG